MVRALGDEDHLLAHVTRGEPAPEGALVVAVAVDMGRVKRGPAQARMSSSRPKL